MDSHSRSASPGGPARPQHRPPSPPTPTPPSPGAFDNRGYQHDDPNHNDSFASNHTQPQQNGHNKEQNGDKKTLEAVNLELINLQPKNGNSKKKDVEVDMNATNPYDEYFVPVNEHRKYMRGEKLYVTADKRGEKGGCKRPLCWTLMGLVVAAIIALIALAATGVLFSNSPTPVEQYNASISTARALGGIGQATHHNHDHNQDHGHAHGHDHTHHLDHTKDDHHAGNDQGETTTSGGDDEYDFENNNDPTIYVPRVMEGDLKLDNEEFTTAISDPDSEEYKKFTENFSQGLKQALSGIGAADINGNDIAIEVMKPRKESSIVTYRIRWKSGFDNDLTNDVTPTELKADLNRYLIRHNRMISGYRVADDGMEIRRVYDLCQINNNNCEHGCDFDESTLDFTCTCPQAQTLDITNPHKCIFKLESNFNDNIKQKELNSSTVKMNSAEDIRRSESNVFDWKETNKEISETTTAMDPDLTFSHIFGHESNVDDEQSTKPKPEPEPSLKPKSEADPTSIPEPEPEPSSKPEPEADSPFIPQPEPEPSSEPEPEPEPSTTPQPEPEPSLKSEPQPEPSSNLAPEPEPSSNTVPEPEPSSNTVPEPEPSSIPEPEPEPTSKPDLEPEPTSNPEPEAEPSSKLESTSEPSSIPEPEPSSRSEQGPESSATLEAKPTSEPEPEPKAVSEASLARGFNPSTESGTELSSEPEPETFSKSVSDFSIEPEPGLSSGLATEHSSEQTSEPPVETTPETKIAPELEPAPEHNSTLQLKVEINSEPTITLSPMTELKTGAQTISTLNPVTSPNPELDPKYEHDIRTETIPELATDSKPGTELIVESEQIFGQEQNKELKPQLTPETPKEELKSATEAIFESTSQFQIDSESNTKLPEVYLEVEPETEIKIESSTEKNPGHDPISNNNSDESIGSSSEVSTDRDGDDQITTPKPLMTDDHPINKTSYETMQELLSIKNFNFTGSNTDNDWLEYDKNITAVLNNNSDYSNTNHTHLNKPKSFKDTVSALNSASYPMATENELSFEHIAKNEVPSEIDDEKTKGTPAPTVNMTEDKNIAVESLDNILINPVNNKSENKVDPYNNVQADHPVSEIYKEDNLPTKRMEDDEHIFKSFSTENINETGTVEEQIHENHKNTYEPETIGEENYNEPDENSYNSFGFINSLFNRSSKSIDKKNTTDVDNVMSNTTSQESSMSTDSDWLTESTTEVNNIKMFDKIPEDETTTINKLEDVMNPEIENDDLEPDYLKNMGKISTKVAEQDVPVYVSHDYDNDELRVKRVNDELKNNTNLTETTVDISKISEIIETTTLSEYLYKTAEKASNNSKVLYLDTDQISKHKDMNQSEPAPVWEESDNDKQFISTDPLETTTTFKTIDQAFMNMSTQIMTGNTTPVNNFNVTIYEISALNNHSFPTTKHMNSQSSEYDDHETEMNPFLPEIENNKSLVKKLQEGHDLEPTNLNDTQNENNDDHLISIARLINEKNRSSTELNINGFTTARPEIFDDTRNIHSNSSGAINKTITENYSLEHRNKEDMQSISTFLIDTDDLDKEHTTAPSPIMVKKYLENESSSPTALAEKTTISTTINVNDNMEFLSVVPINQNQVEEKIPKKDFKSENTMEFNDIRTLDLTK